mmetsp:Transcript_6907/g.25760  ORF Transcript_6907/g.25760 Transcript_6907/m.25760 type:complete len:92 (-) Transcript_6907:369-644(-)
MIHHCWLPPAAPPVRSHVSLFFPLLTLSHILIPHPHLIKIGVPFIGMSNPSRPRQWLNSIYRAPVAQLLRVHATQTTPNNRIFYDIPRFIQ